jgi:hypothetical protein
MDGANVAFCSQHTFGGRPQPSFQIRASQLSTQVLFLIAVLNKPDPRNLSAI